MRTHILKAHLLQPSKMGRGRRCSPRGRLRYFSKPPKIAQKTSKNLPKTPPKPLPNRISSCNARNLKKIRPSRTKPSFSTFPDLRKSFQNRYQNAFIIDSLLDALLEPPKIRIWMPKRRQDGPLSFHYFEKFRQKNLILPVFGP